MYIPSETPAILVFWCVSFFSPVIHRNTDKARVQYSVEGNFYAADQGWIHSSAHHYLWDPGLSPLLWGQLFQYGTHPSHESNLLFMVFPCFLLVCHLMLALIVKQQWVYRTTVKVMRTCGSVIWLHLASQLRICMWLYLFERAARRIWWWSV